MDHDYGGQRYTPLDQISAKNAADLAQVCSYTFPDKEASQTAPIVYDGILYATTAHHTVAVDGANCKLVWQSEWKPRDHETYITQRGAAIKDGKVVRGTGDGYLLALDGKTGKELWSRQIAKPGEGHFISMPPLIYEDLVLIGPAGSEFASKGWVGAFRLSNGEPVWKFNTVPDPGEPGAETWGDPNALKHGGGNLWTPMSLDVEKELLYVPVGNPAPDFYGENRPGANLYTGSIVALDVRTGKLAWYYQAVPHDVRDYDLTHLAPVFTTTVGGQQRTVIALTGKDGVLRALDRDTRDVIREPDMRERAQKIAKAMLDGLIWLPEVDKSTHYHAYWVRPSWVGEMKKMYKYGVHTFYRPKAWGNGSDAPSWGTPAQTAALSAELAEEAKSEAELSPHSVRR